MPEPDLNLTWLQRQIDRLKVIGEAEDDSRTKQLSDYKFSVGDHLNNYQWSPEMQAARVGRTMFTINRADQYIKRGVNKILQEMPVGKVIPVSAPDDIDVAEDIEGIIRHIQTTSDADIAHMTAVDHQWRMGVGYWRIYPERKGAGPNQDLCIKRIRNRFTVYFDPASQDPAGADAREAYITEHLEKEAYLERYPEGQLASGLKDGRGVGDMPPSWIKSGGYQVCEVWRVVPDPENPGEKHVEWAVINGIEVLEGNDAKTGPRYYPIPFVPIVRVLGAESDIDGELDVCGVARSSVHAQQYSNYLKSNAGEGASGATKAPYIGYEGQFENHPEWDMAHQKNFGKLEAKPTVKGLPNQILPLPQRSSIAIEIQGLAILAQQADNDVRATLGEADVDARERHPEQSGVAIKDRERQGDIANAHMRVQLGRSLRHEIRILLAWIPHIYDAPRQLRIMGRDEQQKTIIVHAGNAEAVQSMGLPPDVKVYDMSELEFDVTISNAPSYQTQMQEVKEMAGQLIQADPAVFAPLLLDKWLESFGTPWALQAAQRAKEKFGIEDNGKKGEQPIPPKVKMQMQQLQQQHQAAMQDLQAKTEYIQSEQQKMDSEERRNMAQIQSKEKIAHAEIDSKELIELRKLKVEYEIAQLKADMSVHQQSTDLQHESQESNMERQQEFAQGRQEHAHEAGLTGMQMHHESLEAGAGRRHESAEAEAARAHESQEADATREHASGEAERDRRTQVQVHGMGHSGDE